MASSITYLTTTIDGARGLKPYKRKLTRRLSDLRGYFLDKGLVEEILSKGEDPIIYEVYEIPQEPTDGLLSIGCTVIYPGKIGDEYYFTKGHFHTKESASEVYIGVEGEGIILMQNKEGETAHSRIEPNVIVYIPPGVAHRTINVGSGKLIFLAVYPSDAGHDYGSIEKLGFAKLVVERDGKPEVVDNPNYVKAS